MSKHARQEQVIVPAMSATLAELTPWSKHYGQVECPFCQATAVVAGPVKGKGAAWLYTACEHSQGVAAGHGYDITVLFKGVCK